MMGLSKLRLQKEIDATKETIIKLKQIEQDSIDGVEVNKIVLKSFERELRGCN